MFHSLRARNRTIGCIGAALLVSLALAGGARAEDVDSLEPWNSEYPRVLFLIDRHETMDTSWYGVAGNKTRWEVAVDAIVNTIQQAPPEMKFAIAGTTTNGFSGIAPFDMERPYQIEAIRNASPTIDDGLLASSYWELLDYFDNTTDDVGFADNPWEEECTSIDVIVLGDGIGSDTDDEPTNYQFSGDFMVLGEPTHACNTTGVPHEDKCTLLDDVAFYMVNNDVGLVDETQTIRTHTILLDADNLPTQEGPWAESLFASAADAGAGIYTEAHHPGEVALGISHVMSELLRSRMAVTGAFTSSVGHRLFQGWNEIWGQVSDFRGVPLYRGHFEAFQLNLDPDHATFDVGEVMPSTLTDSGALWDAGQLLASRIANEAENNTLLPDYCGANDPDQYARTLYTNDDLMGPGDDDAGDDDAGDDDAGDDDAGDDDAGPSSNYFLPRDLIDVDADAITSENLGPTLLEYHDYDADCPYEYDFNRDCTVNDLDAQEFVDFLRGVGEAHYGYGGSSLWPTQHTYNYDAPFQHRGVGTDDGRAWKLGSMFMAEPAFADNLPPIVTDDPAFFQFLQAISGYPAAVYVPANDGFLHAFRVPQLADTDGNGFEEHANDGYGGWELWGYIPRHLIQWDSQYHTQFHRALQQKVDGETTLHDGAVNLTYVWMDDIGNGIIDCDGAAEGEIDPSGCEYHRLLVVSMGAGSRYHYALDVTNPCRPRFLWEWIGEASAIASNHHGWAKGMSVGTPVIGDVYDGSTDVDDFVPVVFWSSGTADWDGHSVTSNLDPRPAARWYMTDLLNPANTTFSQTGYQIDSSLSNFICDTSPPPSCTGKYVKNDPAPGLFGTPAAVDYDEDGTIDALYIGSRHGYVYKVLIDNGQLRQDTMEDIDCTDADGCGTCVFAEPATAENQLHTLHNQDSDAVFYRPSVAYDEQGLVRVSWGTGWYGNLFEPYDSGHMYMLIDEHPWECEPGVELVDKLYGCDSAFNPMDLDPGEKLVGPVFTAGGIVFFATYIVGDACDIGHARIWALKLDDCSGAYEAASPFGPEEGSLSVTSGKYIQVEGIPSRFSYSNGGVYISITGADGKVTPLGPIMPQAQTVQQDRVFYTNWRNVF